MTLALLTLIGCSSLVTIEVDTEATATVEQGSILEQLVGSMGFGDFTNMDITASDELQNQGVEPGDIEDVRLTTFTLEVTSAEPTDLAFLEDLEVYVAAPELDEQLLASYAGFEEGQRFAEMVIEDLDLTEYVVSEAMTLSTEITGRRPEQTTEVKAYVALDVGVTAQGIRNQATAD